MSKQVMMITPESLNDLSISVSILVFVLILVLIISEIGYYSDTELKFDYEVDKMVEE